MASEKPGSVEQDKDSSLVTFEDSLLCSMENLDRSSPELWPEKYQGVSHFLSSFASPTSASKPAPYSKTLTEEDQAYSFQLQQLPIPALIAKVKELHDIAYQLGVEEAKEMTRGKYLNIFSRSRRPY